MKSDSDEILINDITGINSPDDTIINDVNDALPANMNRDVLLLNFIETYRELPVLWDVASKEYSNKDKKIKAYDELLNIYKRIKSNATRDDVKRKINSLRPNYRKELRKVNSSKRTDTGTEEVYVPKCWTFKELSFFSETSLNYVAPSICSESQQANDIEDTEEIEMSKIVESSVTPTITQQLKKRAAKSQATRQNELLSAACEYLTKNDSEADIVAKSWALKLGKLKDEQRIWAEKCINDVLLEAELGTLHRNSVVINQPFHYYQSPSYSTTPSPAPSAAASSIAPQRAEDVQNNVQDFLSNYTELT